MRNIRKLLAKMLLALDRERSERGKLQKLILAEMILRLRYGRKKRFGLFVIYGWQKKWNKRYADIPDAEQDIFSKSRVDIFDRKSFKKILSTIDFDGAILIDRAGGILNSGIVIEGLRPRRLANLLSPDKPHQDLSSRLGFKKKVHTRHLAAITASYELKGTAVFTVSEETGDVHIFEKGKILFSTLGKEETPKSS